MVNQRESNVHIGPQVGLSLRDGHSHRVSPVRRRAGEIREKPSVDVMDLRSPHVAITPHRPPSGREDVALQLPGHQVGGEIYGEGRLGGPVSGEVGGGHRQVAATG